MYEQNNIIWMNKVKSMWYKFCDILSAQVATRVRSCFGKLESPSVRRNSRVLPFIHRT